VKKKMISLWKSSGKQGRATGERVILTRRGTIRRLCLHPLLHYCPYVPLDCVSGSVSGAKARVAFQLRRKEKGGAMISGSLVNSSSQTASPFQFPFIVLLHGRGAIFNLQPSISSPPSTSIIVANFIALQLQSSLPTSYLVTNFNPRRLSNSKPRHCAISSPSP
jgi:hypothetical protein